MVGVRDIAGLFAVVISHTHLRLSLYQVGLSESCTAWHIVASQSEGVPHAVAFAHLGQILAAEACHLHLEAECGAVGCEL